MPTSPSTYTRARQVNKRRQQASVNVKELFNLSQGGKQGVWVVPACYAILAKECVYVASG